MAAPVLSRSKAVSEIRRQMRHLRRRRAAWVANSAARRQRRRPLLPKASRKAHPLRNATRRRLREKVRRGLARLSRRAKKN